ncbi:hypothetical protein [Bartonella taylorii]|uniref:hypothetical protein n=1 Tax=Bartonella taylorii TaxID=33046 RepID=UPI001ABB3309|nr:hypothetical protein [Bartonella taylorii]
MLRAFVDDIANVLDVLEDALYEIVENTHRKALGDKFISFTRIEKLSEEYQEKTLIGKTG